MRNKNFIKLIISASGRDRAILSKWFFKVASIPGLDPVKIA